MGIIRVQVVQQLRCVIMVKGETDSFLGIPWILCIINAGMSTQFCNTYIYIYYPFSQNWKFPWIERGYGGKNYNTWFNAKMALRARLQ